MASTKKAETCKLQVTIDVGTDRILQDMVSLGIHGTSRSEVAASIIRGWLWENAEKLRQSGVLIVRTPPAKRTTN